MKTKAHIAGRLAFFDGRQVVDNPRKGKSRAQWVAGWLEAQAERRAEPSPVNATPESRSVARRLAEWAKENL